MFKNSRLFKALWGRHGHSQEQPRGGRPSNHAGFAFALEPLENRVLLSTATWTGDAGNNLWSTPTNWVNNLLPATGQDVVIPSTAGNPTINFTNVAGTVSINSLTSADPLELSGGTLTLATTLTMTGQNLTFSGGILKGGTLAETGGAKVVATAGGGTLDGVTVNANLDLTQVNNANLTLLDHVVLNGTASIGNAAGTTVGNLYVGAPASAGDSLTGNATILFGGGGGYNFLVNDSNGGGAGGTLTLGPNVQIHGGKGALSNFYSGGTIINQGAVDADTAGGTIAIESGALTNTGTLEATSGGTLLVASPLTVNGQGSLAGYGTGSFTVDANMLGNTTNAAGFNPMEAFTLNGSGTAGSPQLLEAMSDDLGALPAGFTNNFDYSELNIVTGNDVELVDQAHNSAGTGAEAVYTDSLVVPTGATLNLNGLHLYAGVAQVAGTVTGGTVSVVPLPEALAASSTNVTASAGLPISATVASFVSGSIDAPVSDFTATINWGDGAASTPGTITQPGGTGSTFIVTGAHTYAQTGSFPITVSVTATDTSTVTAHSTAQVGPLTLVPAVIEVSGDGQTIAAGSTAASAANGTGFGNLAVPAAADSLTHTFTIANTGTALLSFTNGEVDLVGADPGDFTILTRPAATVALGGSTTFVVAFSPLHLGTRTATVQITTDAQTNPSYTFNVSGTATTPLFDEAYYLAANPDVAAAVAKGTFTSGYQHYIEFGQYEGRQPDAYFNEAFYLAHNSDVAAAVKAGAFTSGFEHFVFYGQKEDRLFNPFYSESFYLSQNPDVAAAVQAGDFTSGFEHFLLFGQYEDRAFSEYFDEATYLSLNPDVATAVKAGDFESGFEHFEIDGIHEDRQFTALFVESFYLEQNPDVAAAVQAGEFTSGYQHFIEFGFAEGRNYSPYFDEATYLAANPDVAAAVEAGEFTSGLEQYVLFGQFENRPGV